MELRKLVIATAAAFSTGAFAAGDYSSSPQRQSQSQGAMPQSQSGQQGQAQSSDVVRQVQQELKQTGIDAGPVDGQWGPLTAKGVKEFQQSQNIQASGQLDEKTLAALGIQEQSSATGSSKAGGTGAAGSSGGSAGRGASAGSSGSSQGAGSPAGASSGSRGETGSGKSSH
jgi:peptidoglycan hydrolase-like protein with peptidoglycan-binding domain